MARYLEQFGMTAFRFLHSSDLHLGRAFGGFPEGIRNRLREARHGAIARLAQAARDGGAATILLAGDTFDVETPAPDTLRHALRAMADAPDLTWVMLPGNHDSLAATELWRRIATDAPANLRAITDPAPFQIGPDAWCLPAPCTHRRAARDLTEAMDAPTPAGALRVGLGHGAITDFSEDGRASGVIPPDRAARSGLDYLALGDWHGQMAVTPTTWYSGTPEQDSFKHAMPGHALLVTLHDSQPAQVQPAQTGSLHWRRIVLDMLPGDDIVQGLAQSLPRAQARDHLVQLVLSGRLTLAERTELEHALDDRAPDFGWFDADLTTLDTEMSVIDLDMIDRAGALRAAAQTLHDEASDPALAQADRDIAKAALARLYALAGQIGA